MKPTGQCLADLIARPGGAGAFSGGELIWDGDNRCDDEQKGVFQTAAWDAHSLATLLDSEPDPHKEDSIALWKTWMGPDYSLQQHRIADTIKT